MSGPTAGLGDERRAGRSRKKNAGAVARRARSRSFHASFNSHTKQTPTQLLPQKSFRITLRRHFSTYLHFTPPQQCPLLLLFPHALSPLCNSGGVLTVVCIISRYPSQVAHRQVKSLSNSPSGTFLSLPSMYDLVADAIQLPYK